MIYHVKIAFSGQWTFDVDRPPQPCIIGVSYKPLELIAGFF